MALTDKLVAIANAIRAKTGKTGALSLERMATEISGITTGITPSGTKVITSNGTHDVTEFANARVEVSSGGINPVGTLLIVENGVYDVTEFAAVDVAVPTGGSDNYHVLPITLSGLGGTAAKNNVILSGNEFVKAHYADEAFFVMLLPLNAADSVQAAATTTFIYTGNRAIANSKSIVYGTRTIGAGASSYASAQNATAKISGSGYNISLRATSAGNISIYTAANMYVPAGNYLLILALAE